MRLGATLWVAALPGLERHKVSQFFSVPAVTDLPRVLAISPSAFTLCSHHKIVKLSRGAIPFFPGAVTLPLTLVIQP